MSTIILVTGGARSGKSSYVQKRAEDLSFSKKRLFIATAVPLDDEMCHRIEKHQQDRDSSWTTIEAPYDLEEPVRAIGNDTVVCIDCLTVWLGNIWYRNNGNEEKLKMCTESLANTLKKWKMTARSELLIVTNEVGWGIVPESPEVRVFRDMAGFLNKSIADIADELILTVCGVSLRIK